MIRNVVSAILLVFLSANANVRAQTKTDEEAVRKLPQEFCDALARHDGHELAKIMAEDVDFHRGGCLPAW